MKLSKQQLDLIKTFISKKGFVYADVQLEIIDHVANAIQDKLEGNSKLNFEEALHQVHASFGIFGFSVLEDSMISGMNKRYNRIFFNNFLSLFNYKYLLLIFLSISLIYALQNLTNNSNTVLTLFILVVIVVLGFVNIWRNYQKYKKFLVFRISSTYLFFIGSVLQIFNFFIYRFKTIYVLNFNVNYIIISCLLVLFVIYMIAANKTLRSGIKESELLASKFELLNFKL